MDAITIVDAHEHNLKHLSLSIPRDKLVVFTGVSGSGKSSLAFDTIFAEGQRRYVESMSAYARQFIGQFEKPRVESIEGLSPTVAIDQKSISRSPRSTVGTITEITDFLRVLYARIGVAHCPKTGVEIRPQSLQGIVESIRRLPEASRVQILAPVVRGRKGEYHKLFGQLRREGFARVRIDGQMHLLEALPDTYRLEKTHRHTIEVVVDRVVIKAQDDGVLARLNKAVDEALKRSDGFVIAQVMGKTEADPARELFFSQHLAAPEAEEGEGLEEMAPRLFSFNSPYGACPACEGLGRLRELSPELIVNNPQKTLLAGAIGPLHKLAGRYYPTFIRQLAKTHRLDLDTPFAELSPAQQAFMLEGNATTRQKAARVTPQAAEPEDDNWFDMIGGFDGAMAILKRRYAHGSEAAREYLESFMVEQTCPACQGARLKPFSLAVTVAGKNIHALSSLSIHQALDFVAGIAESLSDAERQIARQPLFEIEQRLRFLVDVGLGYLTLTRSGESLSGGEAQRIRLAAQIGAGLSGVLYVLDEPSIGLHQHNNRQLIQTLCRLRDQGNSLIVVEHDEETIRTADWVVDIGPGAGAHGGHLIVAGSPQQLAESQGSVTGDYLSGRSRIARPVVCRPGNGLAIEVAGATLHNLKQVSVAFPLGKLIGVTGVSGSGKSTLVFDLLYEAARYHLGRHRVRPQGVDAITGLEHIDKCIDIDQSPIGRTSRSNPATYTGLFDLIRTVFAGTETAKMRGYGPGRFSFNVKGGRCEACKGDGTVTVEMNFLPNAQLVCEVCNGRRYTPETLHAQYQGHSIAQVLAMTVEEALALFAGQSRIQAILTVLHEVGLDYLTLGQPATTLSGGEAQRLKLATELCRKSTGKTLYLLDEPSIGLHWRDLDNLLRLLNRLVDQGNTVIVIEHNLDFIRACDWLIDMGPEGGDAGGEVLVTGTPDAVARCDFSYTGQFLQATEML